MKSKPSYSKTYSDKSGMSHVDLGRTMSQECRDLHSEVLVGRLARFVVHRVEFAIVQDGSHHLVGWVAAPRAARGNANGNSHLGRSSQRILEDVRLTVAS